MLEYKWDTNHFRKICLMLSKLFLYHNKTLFMAVGRIIMFKCTLPTEIFVKECTSVETPECRIEYQTVCGVQPG